MVWLADRVNDTEDCWVEWTQPPCLHKTPFIPAPGRKHKSVYHHSSLIASKSRMAGCLRATVYTLLPLGVIHRSFKSLPAGVRRRRRPGGVQVAGGHGTNLLAAGVPPQSSRSSPSSCEKPNQSISLHCLGHMLHCILGRGLRSSAAWMRGSAQEEEEEEEEEEARTSSTKHQEKR